MIIMPKSYKKVFIAEDEALVLLSFKTYLTDMGFSVVGEANNGIDAVELCIKTNPDILIMDINMPKLNGIQALELINKKSKAPIPCIFITAYSDAELISKAGNAGAYNYLIKPINSNDLRAAINLAIQQHEKILQLSSECDAAKIALEDRKVIERAKGYLMDNFGFKEKQAMEFLQRKSKESNKKLIEVAKMFVEMSKKL